LTLFEDILKLKAAETISYPDYSKKYLTQLVAERETTINNGNDHSEQKI
jgi:hypothetical protein